MKKYVIAFLMMFFCSENVYAQEYTDEEVYQAAYQVLQDNYIKAVDIEELAINGLKGLRKIDKNINIGNDDKRITLYYKGKVLRSKLKPENREDIPGWAQLSLNFVEDLKKVSHRIEENELNNIDVIIEETISNSLDKASHYYREGQSEAAVENKRQRHFIQGIQDNILYIKIGAFNQYTEENLKKALSEDGNYDGIILDLRGSPGGKLSQALKVADMFLSGGIMFMASDKNNKISIYQADEEDMSQDKPLVVLIDGETTSSAELVVSALQSQSRGKIVGTKSFGKGSKQDLYSLANGAIIGITSGYFYTSGERALDGEGINPDICTYGIEDKSKIEKIANKQAQEDCGREKREKKDFDIELAKYIIKSQI